MKGYPIQKRVCGGWGRGVTCAGDGRRNTPPPLSHHPLMNSLPCAYSVRVHSPENPIHPYHHPQCPAPGRPTLQAPAPSLRCRHHHHLPTTEAPLLLLHHEQQHRRHPTRRTLGWRRPGRPQWTSPDPWLWLQGRGSWMGGTWVRTGSCYCWCFRCRWTNHRTGHCWLHGSAQNMCAWG